MARTKADSVQLTDVIIFLITPLWDGIWLCRAYLETSAVASQILGFQACATSPGKIGFCSILLCLSVVNKDLSWDGIFSSQGSDCSCEVFCLLGFWFVSVFVFVLFCVYMCCPWHIIGEPLWLPWLVAPVLVNTAKLALLAFPDVPLEFKQQVLPLCEVIWKHRHPDHFCLLRE